MEDSSLQLKVGERLTRFFVIKNIENRTKRSDDTPFLILELGYDKGRIWANVWDNTEDFLEEHSIGDIVKIQGVIDRYKDQTKIKIEKIRKTVSSDDVKPEGILPSYQGNLSDRKKRLDASITSIKDKHLRTLLESILLEDEFKEKFCSAPAGKLWHHGYIGGLIEHTLVVASICEAVSSQFDHVNPDLLKTAALLHDIGKVETYMTSPYIDYTDDGRLIGHIVIGYNIIKNAIRSRKDFPEELSRQLLHLILSHQGELEKASPVVPMTLEGVLLHYADEIDSKMNAYMRIIREQWSPHQKWSAYVNLINRYIYFGGIETPDQ